MSETTLLIKAALNLTVGAGFDVYLENYGIEILKALQLRPIPTDEDSLTPKLIRFNR